MRDFVRSVEPDATSVSLSEDHKHRFWMVRRVRDRFAPPGYQAQDMMGRALIVGLNPLLSEELPMDVASRAAAGILRPRGVEHAGFVNLFTRRLGSPGALLTETERNHAEADAVLEWALDWLVAPDCRSKSRFLILAPGKPEAPRGGLADETRDRLDFVRVLAAARGIRPMGYVGTGFMSTGTEWPCSTDQYGKAPGDLAWI